MTFISYAQNFEDVLLWRALKSVGQGFYIDVGAHHPDVDSVTRAFYDRCWSGINVEPVPQAALRLREARSRDITLQLALGAEAGEAAFFIVDGTGLSTLDPTALSRAQDQGFRAREIRTPVRTLAEICRDHVRRPIHFLKIDVEGSEASVLAGADFAAFRPWIVLVEATGPLSSELTHAAWQDILLQRDYRFAWFDGLNRFYVAGEHAEALLPALSLPPNVTDDFLRAADVEWARRLGGAEAQAEELRRLLSEAQRWRRVAEEASERAHLLLATESARRAGADARVERGREEAASLQQVLASERATSSSAHAWLAAMRGSTSWRLTAPLRQAVSLSAKLRGRPSETFAPIPSSGAGEPRMAPSPPQEPPPQRRSPALRTVHQFHSGSATGDAVTNALLLTRRMLRDMGYRSDIFVEHRDAALEGELRLIDELPLHAEYVLMVHHSMGHTALEHLLRLPAPKILYYHNITPEALLPPGLADYARLGRDQLRQLSDHVHAALANSDVSATELRRIGFDPVTVCPLLFDVATLPGVARAKAPGAPFTILFVGRMVESKGQLDLVEAFAEFNRDWGAPARLVLVGRNGGPDEPYCASVLDAIRRNHVDGQVIVTGPVSDSELAEWYGQADLYLSVSRHEGFGVPLIEAMACGVPVLAWPAGAVATTVGDAGALLSSPMPAAVAMELLALARDGQRLRMLAERGRSALPRLSLERQRPKLAVALARAGAAPPIDQEARATLARSLRYTVTGHVNGSYSLSAVNTSLALALEQERPGQVRVLPVEEGAPTSDIMRVGPHCRQLVARLAGRPAFEDGAEIVVSQHYPAYQPPLPGDVPLALFFWEESLIPAETVATLNDGFRGVLAPSRFVAKALLDSGVHVPIHLLPQAPALHAYEALGAERRARPTGRPFTFLHVSSCFPRKGVDVLLAAYAKAFRADDDVLLVIKGFPNPHNDVPDQIAALDMHDPGHPAIRFVNEDSAAASLLQLYRDADAVVLPSRGEGYNLPAAEAMAAGIPLIATGFGGHRDFCGPDQARLIDWSFAASASHLATGGSVWAEPRVDDLAVALHDAVADPAGANERAGRARAHILRETRPSGTAAALDEFALDLLLRPPTEPLRVAWVSSWDVRCGVAEYARNIVETMPMDGIAALVVLSDHRSTAVEGERRVRPMWRSGDPASVAALARALTEEDPHVVVLQHQPGLLSWAELATLLLAPGIEPSRCLLTLHNTADLGDRPDELRARVLRALARLGRVLVHTIDDLNRLRCWGLLGNVALLPHGTKPLRHRRPARPLAAADPVLIGSYGFFLPSKGLPELVRALPKLRERWSGARLRLVNADYGGAGSAAEIALCRRLAAEAGLADAVEFHTEFLPEQRSLDLLAECDIVVLPYQTSKESSSAAVRSALAAGAPVAVSPLPVFDEAAAAVARLPGTDPDCIAAGLAALLESAEARDALVEAAAPWLLERSWPRVAARLAGMMRGVAVQAR